MHKEHLSTTHKRIKVAAVGALEGALIGTTAAPVGIAIGAIVGGVTAYAAEPFASAAAEYIHTVGWLAQMDPTYPHTEFHPYTPTEPMPDPLPEPVTG